MLGFLSRIAASFLVILITYWSYALVVSPLIEPPVIYIEKPGDAVAGATRKTPGADEMERLFPPGSWELDSRKVIETAQGKLLFKDYQPMADGRIRIEPCTLVFYTSSGGDKQGRPIVMRAPEGALLQFDRPLDLARAEIGRLIGGRLLGEVKIHSLETEPGKGDDLEILTSNVHLAEDHVKTPNDVHFRYGRNEGQGRDLRITLIPAPHTGDDTGGPMFDGVRKLELFHLDRIRMYTGGKNLFADNSAPAPRRHSHGRKPAEEPIDVTCVGPYEFDFETNVASFDDQVVVLHHVPDAENDRLTCDRLEIIFAPRKSDQEGESATEAPAADVGPSRSVPLNGLIVHRLVARGAPAVMTSPSRASVARGEHLEYDFQLGQIYLEDRQKVMLRGPHQYVEAVKLRYEQASEGKIGRVWADGPGRFDGALRAEGGKHVAAKWRDRLRLQPHEGLHVMSLIGDAEVQMAESGGFSAGEIHVWLKEIPKPPSELAAEKEAKEDDGPKTDVVPDRMLAIDHVVINSPRLTGAADRLKVWFRYEGPQSSPAVATVSSLTRSNTFLAHSMTSQTRLLHTTAMRQPTGGPPPVVPQNQLFGTGGFPVTPRSNAPFAARSSAPPYNRQSPGGLPGQSGQSMSTAREKRPAKKFDLNGKLIQVQLVQRPDADPEVEAVAIDGDVHFRELPQPGNDEPPLDMRGDVLRITSAEKSKAVVRVYGQPAQVSARGMTMSGSNVQLDRGANRLWIEGAGNMVLPPDKNLAAASPKAPIHISWQEKMEFDGSVVQFRRDVRTRTRETNDEGGWTDTTSFGDTLDVTVSRFVDFAADEQPEDVELRRLVYDGGVFIESYGFDRGGVRKSWDRMQIPNLTVDQLTGAILSEGKGWIRSVQLGERKLLAEGGPAATPRQVTRQATPRDVPPKLTFTRVDYQRGITGNLHQKEIMFRDQVETVHGEVPDWNGELNADRPENLGERDVVVTCDQLSLYEMGPWVSKKRRAFELLASGNAVVEGRTFNAQADRLTYAEAKDLVVLEGDGRSNAKLWRQMQIGGERSYAAARKILFWKGENRFEIDNGQFAELSNLGGN